MGQYTPESAGMKVREQKKHDCRHAADASQPMDHTALPVLLYPPNPSFILSLIWP
jgi:hypothetical protein